MTTTGGCSTTQIKTIPVTLPAPFKPSRETVEWCKANNSIVVQNDLVDCTVQGRILERTSDKPAVSKTTWDESKVVSWMWNAVTLPFSWLGGLF